MSVSTTVRFRRSLAAVVLSTALLAGGTACGSGQAAQPRAESTSVQEETVSMASAAELAALAAAVPAAYEADEAAAATPSPSTSAEKQKFAKTRFVANAGLAAGATYQWIVKPYRAGKFKKGAKGRTFALVKAGLAGAFAYNRLKAASDNAKGDPLLSKAMVPLTAGIESLKGLGTKLRKGQAGDADIDAFNNVIGGVKDAGKSAGAPVTDQVPSLSQLGG
ncbi:hypothetical protein AB0P12_07010 [Streptomyces subrutilus]|uniref:Lipoprotein n=1 Tax=Streptomyces subrutilus TaxID=36818 RepID=A0A5P2UN86_9ACTN|nr:hypothetical protein [Streptomyces subrutilus]QEU80796.1 hypothetical protein CP968_23195 [Streptomyces subrutilus]WSJ29912.1 hypothetical protein OG479_11655 [Streptomyces subrutilus]